MWIGATLTVYGMGLVFLVLAVLWALISLLIRLDRPPDVPAAAAAERAAPGLEPALLAAIATVCRSHRMTMRKQAAPEMRMHEPGSLPSRWVSIGRTRQNRSWNAGGRYS